MNFLGIGTLELLVVFLVAFLALGPGKSIEMARTTGKILRDLRRTFDEVTSAVNLEGDDRRSSPNRRPPSSSSSDASSASRPASTGEEPPPSNSQ